MRNESKSNIGFNLLEERLRIDIEISQSCSGGGGIRKHGEELVGVVSIVDNIVAITEGLAHVGTLAGISEDIEGSGDQVAHGAGERKGEVLVEVFEGLVEVTDSLGTNVGGGVRHEGGEELNDQVERGKDGVEGLLGELLVSIKGALEVGVGGLLSVLSGG